MLGIYWSANISSVREREVQSPHTGTNYLWHRAPRAGRVTIEAAAPLAAAAEFDGAVAAAATDGRKPPKAAHSHRASIRTPRTRPPVPETTT